MQNKSLQENTSSLDTQSVFMLKCCVAFVHNVRVDTYVSSLPLQLSRSQIRQLCSKIILNEKQVKFSQTVRHGDYLEVYFNAPSVKKITKHADVPSAKETLNLDIIHEDSLLLVINKARGQLVHAGNGHADSVTIADAVANKLLSYREEDMLHARAGIVHRLDKDTSGSLLIAKTSEAHTVLSKQFQERVVEKKYLAIVKGVPTNEQDTITVHMDRNRIHRKRFCVVSQGGRETITHYQVLFTNGKYTVLLFTPRTGRTHQLRVLAQYLGCPIVGDELYARKSQNFPFVKLMLHAWTLSFYHPDIILEQLQNQALSSMSTPSIHGNDDTKDRTLRSIISKLGLQATTYTSPIAMDMQNIFKAIGYVL